MSVSLRRRARKQNGGETSGLQFDAWLRPCERIIYTYATSPLLSGSGWMHGCITSPLAQAKGTTQRQGNFTPGSPPSYSRAFHSCQNVGLILRRCDDKRRIACSCSPRHRITLSRTGGNGRCGVGISLGHFASSSSRAVLVVVMSDEFLIQLRWH